ncbi:hypothetical protein Hypma_008164 [Hypsizygus marmoreus]|uniref:Uncharacterized protein n=1 Tax=Hypsizygus marmoreus TaxID=39966 RepID=A0A369JYV0_HYPMA|nr:hypothetical protein Hypma_008164 [Hypsizygus marmoreus]
MAGKLNTIADALSCLPNSVDTSSESIAALFFKICSDSSIFSDIKSGYFEDNWYASIISDLERGLLDSKLDITFYNDLLFISSCLITLWCKDLRKNLFQLIHGNLVTIDFMRPLPEDDSFNQIVTLTDHSNTNL